MFQSVMTSMHTLLVYGALMDEVSSVIEEIQEESIPILILFYFFILLAALTVMNMLIGVICEMVLNVGEAEREASTVTHVKESLRTLIKSSGVDHQDKKDDILISKQDFIDMLKHEKAAVTILDDVGVDLVGLVDFADTIFASDADEDGDDDAENHEKLLTFDEFVAVVLDLRGSKIARVKDVVNLRKHINWHFARFEQRLGLDGSLPKPRQVSNEDEIPRNPARNQTLSFPECVTAALQPGVGAAHEREVAFLQTDRFPERESASAIQPVAAHESEVAFLRAENLRLKEQLASMEERMSSGRAGEGLFGEGSFSGAKSDLVQRCLKDVVSRSASKSGPISLDGFVSGSRTFEQSLPRKVPHSARICTTNGLASPLAPQPSLPVNGTSILEGGRVASKGHHSARICTSNGLAGPLAPQPSLPVNRTSILEGGRVASKGHH